MPEPPTVRFLRTNMPSAPTSLHKEATSFIHADHKSFYQLTIPRPHEQLRHFVSATDEGALYYAAKNEIFSIDVTTHKRKRIVRLEFDAWCLGAGYGWICVGGGDKGRCAFVDVGAQTHVSAVRSTSQEVDEPLPLSWDAPSQLFEDERIDYLSRLAHLARGQNVHDEELGGLVVNAITVHELRSEKEDRTREVVAVIANNNKTITIFSLTQLRTLTVLEFPTPMNHASISPDGNLLVACGDLPQAFFCRRKELPNANTGTNAGEAPDFARYEWQELAQPTLENAVSADSCFTTAFSTSGHMCIIATQAGAITVYDTRRIRKDMGDEEAVIKKMTSTRPHSESRNWNVGAVRSMAFAPRPWDMLVWAEDRARVCVVDLRDGFKTRQVIELDPKAKDIHRQELTDVVEDNGLEEQRELELEAEIYRRFQLQASHADDLVAVANRTADYIHTSIQRLRQQRQSGQQTSDLDPQALTEAERQVLDSLRLEDRIASTPEDLGQQNSDRPFSVHYQGPESRSAETTTMPAHSNERSTPPTSRLFFPRRRSSVVISNSNIGTTSSYPSSLMPVTGPNATLTTSPSQMSSSTATDTTGPSVSSTIVPPAPLSVPSSTTDPWQTISTSMQASTNNLDPGPASQNPFEIRRRALQDRVAAERRQLEPQSSVYEPSPSFQRQRERYNTRQRELERERPVAPVSTTAETTAVQEVNPSRESDPNFERHRERFYTRQRELERERANLLADASTVREANSYRERERERIRQRLRERDIAETAWASAEFGRALNTTRVERARLQNMRRLHDTAGDSGRDDVDYLRLLIGGDGGELEIMGVAWGDAGRNLYVATTQGIFAMKVNIRARMTFPAASLM